jgi:pyruvate formate-lyase activating enzyme-like uncharacterized protein
MPQQGEHSSMSGEPPELTAAKALYADIYADFIAQIESKGVRFEQPFASSQETEKLKDDLISRGVLSFFGGSSLRLGCLSPACTTCVTARRSKTFQISSSCHRNCFFCLNSRERSHDTRPHAPDATSELLSLAEKGIAMEHIALSGGEPLLHKGATLEFFKTAKTCFPHSWTRLYTSGDLLEDDDLERLARSGLDEIRFSFKQEDPPEHQTMLMAKVSEAKKVLSFVAVEMPVIPGDFHYMIQLLRELDARGADSINLLELCFPLSNWQKFARRGLSIRNPPFDILYTYQYAGGLPVAGSELECLRLLDFALGEKLRLGVHYCSLVNKHRSQVFTANIDHASSFADFEFSEEDFFLRTCKVYGAEVEPAKRLLDETGHPCSIEQPANFLQCRPEFRSMLYEGGLHPVLSVNIVEERLGKKVLRELALE